MHRFKTVSPLSQGQPAVSILGASKLCQNGYFCAHYVQAARREGRLEQIMSSAGLGRSQPLSHYLPLWFHPLIAMHQHNKIS